MDTFDFLATSLAEPANALSYTVSERLAALFPDRAMIEGELQYCDIEKFATAGLCSIAPKAVVHNQTTISWDAETGISRTARNAWFEVEWKEETLDVLILTWCTGFCDERFLWILANEEATATGFYDEVSAWNAEIRDEVLVFDGGCWNKSESLFHSIQSATLENLILAGSLKDEIRDDLVRFFAMKESYDRYGVPWKRGILFVGPPGNGKTHAVKALINELGKPCLYVKSFQAEHLTEHDCIRQVFHRARKSAPCILVLEDLDSLINAGNRSFFLNELDGFATNHGVLALATTNHPEKLDPAILDRPSRFDRKYRFDLPGPDERLQYFRLWAASLSPALKPSDDCPIDLSSRTQGVSFAYLKELFLSSMMRWMSNPGTASMDLVLREQADLLRTQMASLPPETDTNEPSASTALPPWMGHFRRSFRS